MTNRAAGTSTARTRALLVADTHLGPGQAGVLLERIGDELTAADVVFHAGDVTDGSILEGLAAVVSGGRVHAVRGNNDHRLDLPERLSVDVGGCTIAMIHDSGAAAGRRARLRRWFPDADVVVFGHSHLPWNDVDVRESDGHVQHHVNPGSAMLRRRADTCSVAHLHIRAGAVVEVRHVPVGTRTDGAAASPPPRGGRQHQSGDASASAR